MANRVWAALACLLGMISSSRADLLWGANGHPFQAYPGISIGQQLDYLEDLGMRSYRVNISDTSQALDLAALVKEAKPRGIAILPVLTPGNLNLEKDSPEELYRKARELATTLGSQFKNDIRVWELGNEMENHAIIQPCETRDDGTTYPCKFGPGSGVAALDYYGPRWAKVSAVLKGMSDGMIAVDPTIRKAMGTAGWGHTGAFELMAKDGIQWDVSVWHTYGEDPKWAFDILSRYGHPIWITEFNNPYGSQRSEHQQADGLEQMMARFRELQGTYKVEAAHLYELLDETYWAPDFEAYMGLVRLTPNGEGGWRTGEPKPAYLRVRNMTRGLRPPPKLQRNCDLTSSDDGDALLSRKVGYSYCLLLARAGDIGGKASWTAALEAGEISVPDMVFGMLRSDEFNRLYQPFGLTDKAYVNFLYRLLLDRGADADGLASYAKQLNKGSVSREKVALGIILSDEFKNRHPLLFDQGD